MTDEKLAVEIGKAVKAKGGRTFYVGGVNRNRFLKKFGYSCAESNKDIDLEIYFIDKQTLINILSRFGEIDFVGKSFGIFKLKHSNLDIALPRREMPAKILHDKQIILVPNPLLPEEELEIKNRYPAYEIVVSPSTVFGHKDFIVIPDSFMSFKEAAERRDFTMNSIMVDVLSGEVLDPFNGVRDIKNRLIRATNPKAFVEDSLRVYRAIQFSARLNFHIEENTKRLCQQVDLSSLPKERVYAELEKLLMKSEKPSIGLRHMEELGIFRYHPLLKTMLDCPQEPSHHPEGSVWNHALMVVDEAAKRKHKSKNPTAFMWAALLHDIGKPATTEVRDEKITTYNHDKKGKELAVDYLKTITDDKRLISEVATLVEHHMKPIFYQKSKDTIKDGAFLKLATKVNLKDLILLSTCDRLGRLGVDVEQEKRKMLWFKNRCERLNILEDKPHPIITGKLLLTLGYKPGPRIGKIIKEAYQIQLEENWDEKQLTDFILNQYPVY